jgi:dTDP-D-glucose 4,6-dehydratase
VSKKRKILVCGSAGFLMSNFIRYILYRSQDFKIVSVDNLENPNDIKRIYFNKHHRFYIGDPSDDHFMNRIIHVEKPDVIVCGDEVLEYEKLLKTTLNLIKYRLPLIQISPIVTHGMNDIYGMYRSMENIVSNMGGTVIRLPNRFGMRQRVSVNENLGMNVAYYINCILTKKRFKVNNIRLPWVCAEDVASFLWYIIERKKRGEILYMPSLDMMSSKEIAAKIIDMYSLEPDLYDIENIDHAALHDVCKEIGWVPDSKDMESALEKTIRWFDANRWAFNE